MGRAAEFILILAATLAVNSGQLSANTLAEGWSAFRDIRPETARGAAVPEASIPDSQEFRASSSTQSAFIYTFDLPVENPSGLNSPIKAADNARSLAVTVVRKGYGSYEAAMEISGATATFKVLRISSGCYLARSGDVNLTAAPGASGGYYDVSGDIHTPAGETLKFKLTLDKDKTMGANERGYKLTLRPDRAAGEIDTRLFSKADAACLIALGMAIHADTLSAPDPSWVPYVPGPWLQVPYNPATSGNNPWYALAAPYNYVGWSGGLKGGRSGGAASQSTKKSSGAAKGGGEGGGGGGSGWGGGGGRHKSSGKAGSAAGRSRASDAKSRPGGRGQKSAAYNNGNSGGRGNGGQRSSGGGSGGKKTAAGRSRRAASAVGGGRNGAGSQKPPVAGSNGGGRRNASAAKNRGGAAGTGPARGSGAGAFPDPRPMSNKTGSGGRQKTAAGNKKGDQQPAAQPRNSSAGKNKLAQLWFGGSRAWHTAGGQPPPMRDSLNDGNGPRRQAAYAVIGGRPDSGGGIAAIVNRGRRVITAVTENLAIAMDNWRAAAAALWTWLKSLI